jgi:hypothetical protein
MELFRKIWNDPVGSKVISVGILGALTSFVTYFLVYWSKIYIWLQNILSYLTLPIVIPLWLLVLLILLFLAIFIVLLWRLYYIFQSENKRLYRFLSPEEKVILKKLARCDFCQTEFEICNSVSVTPQQFLWLIDQLVNKHQLAERTEPTNGGAVWCLSEKGRAFANELKLYNS